MSLMGYEERDIEDMMTALNRASKFVITHPSDLMDKSWVYDLQKAHDLLEGLLVEGRV